MSFWVYLNDEDDYPLSVATHCEGGPYVVGGTEDAELNVTYNYNSFFYECLDHKGLRWLDGQVAANTIERLEMASAALPDAPSTDYWASTPGNAGHVVAILLEWARQHPAGIWRVS